jgi:hypothetical protein
MINQEDMLSVPEKKKKKKKLKDINTKSNISDETQKNEPEYVTSIISPVKKKKKKKKLLSPEGEEISSIKKKKKKKKLLSSESGEVPSVKKKKLLSPEGEEISSIKKKKKKKKLLSPESVEVPSVKKKKKKISGFSVKSEDEVFDDIIIQSDREEVIDFIVEPDDFFSPFSSKEEEVFPMELLDMLTDEDEPPPEIDDDRIPRGGFFGASPTEEVPEKTEEVMESALPQFFLDVTEPAEEEVSLQPEKNIEELLKENYGEIKDFIEILPADDLQITFKPTCDILPDEKGKSPDKKDKKIFKKKKKLKK